MMSSDGWQRLEMIEYLTVEEVLALHKYAIRRYGGSYGVASVDRLESALNTPKQTMFGEELYSTVPTL